MAVILSHCRAHLLPAMMPAAVTPLKSLPRMPNGKTDDKALPEPDWCWAGAPLPQGDDGDGKGSSTIAGPSTETEILLTGIWASSLGLDFNK